MRRKLEFLIFTLLLSGYLYAQQEYILVSGDGICPPDTVSLSVNPDSLDLTSLTWNPIFIINDTISYVVDYDSIGPYKHIFDDPGNHRVRLVSSEDPAIVYARTIVTVRQKLNSEFDSEVSAGPYEYTFMPNEEIADTLSDYYFFYSIFEDSVAIDSSAILFAQAGTLQNANYTYSFPDTGTYMVRLQTQRQIPSCATSSLVQVVVQETPVDTSTLPIANYFAPESQTYFVIDPSDPAVILSFKLYSRTGVLVYSTEAPIIYWDGRNSFGQELGTGVYYYAVETIQGSIGIDEPIMGFIHLFRN